MTIVISNTELHLKNQFFPTTMNTQFPLFFGFRAVSPHINRNFATIENRVMELRYVNVLASIAVAMLLAGCTGNNQETAVKDTLTTADAEKHTHPADITRTEEGQPDFTVDEVFRQQLTQFFKSYIDLKDAFVESDAGKVKRKTADARKSLEKVDMSLVDGPAQTDWTVYRDELSRELQAIEQGSNIDNQRERFSKLSYSLYKAIKAFGLGGETAYYDFCPMAFNDKGAYWLSDTKTIRNPYFGDKMLTCGSIEETLR
jgi:hypothetical protein